MTTTTPTDLAERLIRGSERQGDCLVWSGCVDRWGRGVMKHDGAAVRVQRLAWIAAHGPLTADTQVRQTCDEPLCVEPSHLVAERQFRTPAVMTSARLPVPLVEESRARAARAGMTWTDVMTAALASWLTRP